jgi:hypothetical protein
MPNALHKGVTSVKDACCGVGFAIYLAFGCNKSCRIFWNCHPFGRGVILQAVISQQTLEADEIYYQPKG